MFIADTNGSVTNDYEPVLLTIFLQVRVNCKSPDTFISRLQYNEESSICSDKWDDEGI